MSSKMNWLTSFSFLLILFISQQDYAEGRRGGSGANSKSPWANVNKANAFMKCLIQKIAASPAFPQQEKEDMESIVETMMSAISSMGLSHRGNTQAQLQAMNMAFASSMAELVIAEDPGNMDAISVKTDALSKTLHTCFKSTMGTVNRQFIAEIKDLIKVFAQEAAARGDDNDIDDQEQYDSQANDNIYSISTGTFESQQFRPAGSNLGQTDFEANTYGSFGYGGPGGPGGSIYGIPGGAPGGPDYGGPGGAPGGPAGDLSGVANGLAQALANSKTFRSIFGSGVNSQIAVQILTSSVQSTLSSSLRLGSNVSQGIVSSLQKSVLNLGGRIDVNSLASALASTLVSGLSSAGVLSSSNAADLGVSLVTGILQSASGIAPQFGIRVSQSDLSSDISSVTNVIRTSISSLTSSTSLSSINVGGPDGLNIGGPDFGAGGPGYGGPGGAPGGPDYGGPGGAPGGSQAPSSPRGFSVSSLLSSPNGLTSRSASARIQSLASGILNALGPNGVDVGALSKSLASTLSRAVSSGFSPSDAKIEALLETIAALVSILSSASISSVNLASSSGISSSVASSLSVVMA